MHSEIDFKVFRNNFVFKRQLPSAVVSETGTRKRLSILVESCFKHAQLLHLIHCTAGKNRQSQCTVMLVLARNLVFLQLQHTFVTIDSNFFFSNSAGQWSLWAQTFQSLVFVVFQSKLTFVFKRVFWSC